MTTETSNPRIEDIRQRVQTSYNDLNQLINIQLVELEPEQLYQAPEQDEWTIMESLAHIVEFMPYWGDEFEKLVAHPGQPFGRTKQDEGRLRALQEHGSDTLEHIRQALPASYAHLDRVLSALKDDNLQLTGIHSTFGTQKLAWFIDEFVTRHLIAHLEQLKATIEKLKATQT